MSLKEQWYKGRLQNQKLAKQIQQSVKLMKKTAQLDKDQRQIVLGIRNQGVVQLLNGFEQEDIQRQNKTQEMHQAALADKQDRQTEIAERKQYVWGDQAGLVGLPKSEMSQPMQPHSSDNSHQEPEHHEQYQEPEHHEQYQGHEHQDY